MIKDSNFIIVNQKYWFEFKQHIYPSHNVTSSIKGKDFRVFNLTIWSCYTIRKPSNILHSFLLKYLWVFLKHFSIRSLTHNDARDKQGVASHLQVWVKQRCLHLVTRYSFSLVVGSLCKLQNLQFLDIVIRFFSFLCLTIHIQCSFISFFFLTSHFSLALFFTVNLKGIRPIF